MLAIRTSTLEEKATACNMIVCYLDELKEGFFPYVQEVRGLLWGVGARGGGGLGQHSGHDVAVLRPIAFPGTSNN